MSDPVDFLQPIDLTGLEILNACFQNLATDPSSPTEGRFYWNTVSKTLQIYDDTNNVWVTPSMSGSDILTALLTVDGTGSGLDADLLDGQHGTYFLSRTNHTGSQLASTISDFNTAVRLNRLDQMAVPTGSVDANSQKIINVSNGTNAADAVNFGQLSSIAQGLNPKPGATVATAAALPACTYANGTSGVGATLTGNSNGALTVDSYGVAAADVVLVKNQGTGAENGLYTVTQAGSGGTPFILTRHTSMDTTAEFSRASIVVEDAGTTTANSFWVCTNSANPTVGTTSITFSQLNGATQLSGTSNRISISGNTVDISATYVGQTSITTLGTVTTGVWQGTAVAVAFGGTGSSTAAGARSNLNAAGIWTDTIGDNSSTSFAITQATHGLAVTNKMTVAVYRVSTGAQVGTNVSVNNSNGTVTISFAVAPTTNQFRYVIHG